MHSRPLNTDQIIDYLIDYEGNVQFRGDVVFGNIVIPRQHLRNQRDTIGYPPAPGALREFIFPTVTVLTKDVTLGRIDDVQRTIAYDLRPIMAAILHDAWWIRSLIDENHRAGRPIHSCRSEKLPVSETLITIELEIAETRAAIDEAILELSFLNREKLWNDRQRSWRKRMNRWTALIDRLGNEFRT